MEGSDLIEDAKANMVTCRNRQRSPRPAWGQCQPPGCAIGRERRLRLHLQPSFFKGQRSRFRMRVKLDTETRRPNTTAEMSARISSMVGCEAARSVFCKAPAEGTKTFIFFRNNFATGSAGRPRLAFDAKRLRSLPSASSDSTIASDTQKPPPMEDTNRSKCLSAAFARAPDISFLAATL